MRAQSYFFFLNEKNGINSQIVSEFPCHLTLWIVQFNKRDEKKNKTKTNVCIKKKQQRHATVFLHLLHVRFISAECTVSMNTKICFAIHI